MRVTNLPAQLGRIDDPYIDGGARHLTRTWLALASLQAVHAVIGGLQQASKWTSAEHSPAIEGGFGEVVEVPYLVRVASSPKPEIDLHNESSGLRRYPTGGAAPLTASFQGRSCAVANVAGLPVTSIVTRCRSVTLPRLSSDRQSLARRWLLGESISVAEPGTR
jgi:hypothetical protein